MTEFHSTKTTCYDTNNREDSNESNATLNRYEFGHHNTVDATEERILVMGDLFIH